MIGEMQIQQTNPSSVIWVPEFGLLEARHLEPGKKFEGRLYRLSVEAVKGLSEIVGFCAKFETTTVRQAFVDIFKTQGLAQLEIDRNTKPTDVSLRYMRDRWNVVDVASKGADALRPWIKTSYQAPFLPDKVFTGIAEHVRARAEDLGQFYIRLNFKERTCGLIAEVSKANQFPVGAFAVCSLPQDEAQAVPISEVSELEVIQESEVKQEPVIKQAFERKQEPEIKPEPEITQEPEIKPESEVTQEPELMLESEIKQETEIKVEFETRLETETSLESEIKAEPEAISASEAPVVRDVAPEGAPSQPESFQMESFQMVDSQPESPQPQSSQIIASQMNSLDEAQTIAEPAKQLETFFQPLPHAQEETPVKDTSSEKVPAQQVLTEQIPTGSRTLSASAIETPQVSLQASSIQGKPLVTPPRYEKPAFAQEPVKYPSSRLLASDSQPKYAVYSKSEVDQLMKQQAESITSGLSGKISSQQRLLQEAIASQEKTFTKITDKFLSEFDAARVKLDQSTKSAQDATKHELDLFKSQLAKELEQYRAQINKHVIPLSKTVDEKIKALQATSKQAPDSLKPLLMKSIGVVLLVVLIANVVLFLQLMKLSEISQLKSQISDLSRKVDKLSLPQPTIEPQKLR